MSDSVANLTVKVDTKSVSAAVQALDKLAAVAAKVEKSVGNIGAASAKQSQSAQSLEKWASKSESAFAKMEKRLEEGAKKYEQITRLVNKHALSEGMRADTMNRVNRAFEQYNRVAGNINATTLQMDRATRRYNQAIEQTKTGIDSVIKLENQRATEAKKNAAEAVRAAKEAMQGSRAVFRQAGGYQSLIDQQLGLTPQQSNIRNAELAKLRSQIERSLTPTTGVVSRQAGGYQSLIDQQLGLTPQQSNIRNAELAKLRSQIERSLTPATGMVSRQAGGYQSLIDQQLGLTPQQSNIRNAELAKLRSQIERSLTPATGMVSRQAGGYQSLIDQQLGLTPQQSNIRNAELAKLRSQIERSLTPATGMASRQAGGYQSLIDRLTSGGTGRQNDLASFYADQEKKATAQIDKSARALQAKLQQAQGAAQGIILRAGRQLSPETGAGIIRQAEVALARYTSALNTHGVKSLEADRAAGAFKATMRGLSSEIARVGGLLPRISDNARVFSAAFGAANASVKGFSRVLFNTNAALAALTGAFAVREITTSIMEFEKFTNTLRTVSSTSGEFQRNLQFLTSEANRVGFSVGEVGNSFARLSLAMKGAGFSGDETRTSFTRLTEAARNFGLSSADTMGVIRALEQSMSKGKFMAEEVRLQLGDRLPIAMAALDKAVTIVDGRQADLNKRFEEGSIDVKRYGLEFIRQINLMSGGAEALARTSNSISASFGRLGTEFSLFSNAIGEGGLSNAVITFSNSLTETLKTLREIGATDTIGAAFAALSDTILLVIKGLTETIRLLKEIGALDVLNWLLGTVSKLAQAISGLLGASNQFTKSINEINKASVKVNDSISEFNEVLFRNKQTLDASSTAIERRIEANKRLGMSESDAIAAAAEAERKRMEIERSSAQRELAAAERAAAVMRRGLSPRIRVVGTTLQNLETALESSSLTTAMRSALEAERQAFAAANPTVNDFLNGTLSALDAVNKLNAAFAGKEIPSAINEIRQKLIEASLDTRFQATTDSLIAARKRVSDLDLAITEFANKFSSGVYVQFTIDIIRQQEAGARATTGSLTDLQQTAVRAISDTQSTAKIAEATRTVLRETGMLERFAGAADMSDKQLIKLVRSNEAFRSVLPEVAKELDKVKIKEEGVSGVREKSENTLEKYIATLRAQIQDQDKIAAAYRVSTQAGEDAELQLKAETEAIRLANGDEAKRIAIKKQILPLLQKEAEGEKDVAAAKDLPRMRDEIALLEKERSLLGESVALREQELAAFRARQQLEGRDPGVVAEAEQLARKTVKLRQENQQLESSYNELANIGVKAFEQVGDAITEAFAKGEIRALNFGNVIRGVMSSIVQSILRLGVVNPIINSIFSGTMLPTLGAGLSVLGGGGAAAAGAAGGGGGIMQLLGLSSLIPKEGILGSLGLTGPGGLLSRSIISAGQPVISSSALLAAGEPGLALSGIPGATTPVGGLSFGGLLGGLGMGATAGGLLASFTGGNTMGGSIGGALGGGGASILAAIPAIAGFLGPLAPFAPILGGLLGGGLGGLIGPKPSVQGYGFRLQSAGYGPDATPANAMATSLLPISRQFYNESGAAAFQQAEQVVAATNAYLAQRGLLVGGVSIVGGNRFGPDYSWADAGSIEEAFTRLRFGAGSNTELNRALSGRTFGGLEPLQQFVEGFVSLQDTIKSLTADPVPEFTQQMNALIDSFAQAAAKAREYGYGEEELARARERQIAKLEEQRSLTIRDTALELEVRRLMAEGMEQEAQRIELAYRTQKEIESFTASLDALGISAEEKSRLLVELERTQAAERVKILKDANKNIRDYLDSLRTSSPLSGTTTMGRLGAAQELFNRDLAAAQTGNVDALNRITQSADTLLNLAREVYASTGGFHDIRGRVVSGLESLATTPMSQQSLPDLASVPLVAEMTNLRTNAAIAETAEYTKRFDSKLAELLPIAEAIQAAVEQANEVSSVGFDGGSQSAGEGSGGGGGGGGLGGGGQYALGGAFRHGRVMAYANGGIPDYVNSPTLAPMALFGEAGPEAIMPLRRGPDGRLGVEVNGSDNQAVVSELRAVRDEIVSLREATADSDGNESTGLVEAIAELRVQVGGLREELRTTRLRAQ